MKTSLTGRRDDGQVKQVKIKGRRLCVPASPFGCTRGVCSGGEGMYTLEPNTIKDTADKFKTVSGRAGKPADVVIIS